MTMLQQMQWVLKALYSQKLRTSLTLLGFAVGIASVTLLSALGEGARQFIMSEFTQFGSRILAITPGKTETMGLGGLLNTTRPLSLDDAVALSRLSHVNFVVPVVMGTARIDSNRRSRHTQVLGVNHQAAQAWQLKVAQGKFLPNDELERSRSFAVLGSQLKQELFGNNTAIGKVIRVGEQRFRVVGIMAPKGEFLGTNLDDLAYIPAQKSMQLFNRESLMEIDVFYSENTSVTTIEKSVKQTLIRRHKMEDFTIISQDTVLSSLDRILGMITYAAGSLGGIALLVGGISVLTIQNITVAERRQEIGLLRSLGFSQSLLLRLFLFEAIAIACVGGVIGYSFVFFPMIFLYWLVPNFPMDLRFEILLLAIALSGVIGALAGIRPAKTASQLPPIEALREE